MNFRMLTYLTEVHKKYNLPIVQLVIYLGKGKMNMKDNIKFETKNTKIDYKYHLVNIADLDCESFVNSDNSNLVVLGILCDFKKRDKHLVVRKICNRLNELCKDDENEMENKLLKLETFSRLRELEDVVKKEEEMLEFKIKISDLPSYSIGHEQGIEQGAKNKAIEIAKNSISRGLDNKTISLITNLSIEQIEELRQ